MLCRPSLALPALATPALAGARDDEPADGPWQEFEP